MRQQITFRQYNPNKPHHYGLLLKSLNDARFPDTTKLYRMLQNRRDGPYYLKSQVWSQQIGF